MRREGLPIAAYLGIMLALALGAAFIAVFAILIWLPPRPPDVMRADIVADYFTSGYHHMREHGRPITDGAMRWRVVRNAPNVEEAAAMEPTRQRIAQRLGVDEGQIMVAANKIVESERFVFEVRDIEEAAQEAERAAREAIREVELRRAREAVANAREALEELQRLRAEADEEHRRDLAEIEAEQQRELAQAERERMRAEAQLARERARAERQAEHDRRRREDAARRAQEARERAAEARERVAERMAELRRQGFNVPEIPAPPEPPEAHEPPDVHIEADIPDIVVPRVAITPAIPATPRPPAAAPAPPGRPAASAAPAPAPAPPAPPVVVTVPQVRVFAPAPEGVVLVSGFEIAAQLPDDRWLVMRQGRNWDELGWLLRAGAIIGGALLAVTLLAILFARRLTRPIRHFSQAVQAVGVNPQSEPVAEEGPTELRGAARAVNTMQARLRALIADRTKTLAAVAHDMRTPLMRLRLAAENSPPEQRDRMAKEIGEVEALVASFIAFARDDPAEEARVRVDLAALLQSIADDHREAGRDVAYAGDERAVITGQSLGLKRLFSNLVDNALKYAGNARMTLIVHDGEVIVDVEDDGPGIPAAMRESVFEPFVRLNEEGARGAGLGLAAARSIARAHGGDIAILESVKGAKLRVTLPG